MILCVKAMCATWQREQSLSVLLGGGTKVHFPWEMACQFLTVGPVIYTGYLPKSKENMPT